MANPPPDATTPHQVDDKFRLAREVIGALDRALRTRRMYQPDHQIYQENTAEVLQRMVEFFDKYAYLRLEVVPDELRIEGQMVVQAAARPTELPFRLYKDGIREIRFHRGLTKEELLEFINIMELAAEDLSHLSEDYVSLLWSKDFKNIDYLAVDEFELAEAESPLGLDPQQTRVAHEVRQRVDEAVRRVVARELDSGAGERRAAYRLGIDEASLAFPQTSLGYYDEDVGVLASIEPIRREPEPAPEPAEGPAVATETIDSMCLMESQEVAAGLRAEVENETIGGAIRRSIDILTRLQGPAVQAAPLLRGVVEFYVAKGDFGSIGHLLSHLHETGVIEKWPGGLDLWEQLVVAVRRPDLKKAFISYLNRLYGDDAGLQRYFNVVGPAVVRLACQAYPLVQNARGRQSLRQYLMEFGVADPTAFRDLVTQSGEKFLAEVFDIVREVRPPGVALDLESYLKNPSTLMRRQALTIAGRGEGALRSRTLIAALGDPDAGVRAHALDVIAQTRDAALRPPLLEWIEKGDFVHRDWAEKEAAMRALARVGGTAGCAYLKSVASRSPGMLNRAKGVETRRAAVIGLKELASAEALEFLRTAARGSDEQLAQFAVEALGATKAKTKEGAGG